MMAGYYCYYLYVSLFLFVWSLQTQAFVGIILHRNNAHSVVVPTTAPGQPPAATSATTTTVLYEMKRPILDQIATTVFRLETARVEASSETDEKGRIGEPMEWSNKDSWVNRFSELTASGAGYGFKQWVANFVAGEFDEDAIGNHSSVLRIQYGSHVFLYHMSFLSSCQGYFG